MNEEFEKRRKEFNEREEKKSGERKKEIFDHIVKIESLLKLEFRNDMDLSLLDFYDFREKIFKRLGIKKLSIEEFFQELAKRKKNDK